MAYTITLSLGRLKEDVVQHALSAEDAAYAAWEICDSYGLDMPNENWSMKTWDTMEGEYETSPVTDHMVRGSGGKYPSKVEFCHVVIDALTANRNDSMSAMIMMRAGMPYTQEPGGSEHKFEMLGVAMIEW